MNIRIALPGAVLLLLLSTFSATQSTGIVVAKCTVYMVGEISVKAF